MAILNESQRKAFDAFLKKEYERKFEAITSRGTNILLSAGAGCGKTTALSLRVVYQVLCSGISLSEMLILTFTDNAAREMKERIKEDLIAFADPSRYPFISPEAASLLLSESKKAETAMICTFDSFANGIVKKYADRLGISSKFTVLDGQVSRFLFAKEEDALIDREFSDPNSPIRNYFDRSRAVNNLRLKQTIGKLEEIREEQGDDFFKSWQERYLSMDLIKRLDRMALSIFLKRIEDLAETFERFAKRYGDCEAIDSAPGEKDFFHKSAAFLRKLVEEHREAEDGQEAIQELGEALSRFSLSGGGKETEHSLRPKDRQWLSKNYTKGEFAGTPQEQILEKLRDAMKNEAEGLQKLTRSILSDEETYRLMQEQAKPLRYAVELDLKIHEKIREQKRKSAAYSFHDIASMCLELLQRDGDARQEERERIRSIMVDEYQDSNEGQERLLAILGTTEEGYQGYLLTGEKKALFDRGITFLVGDVKQSIYGFRKAKPTLFLSKYLHPEEHRCKVLSMEDNYRSDKAVIDQVNSFFKACMTKRVGGVDYAGDPHQQIAWANRAYAGIPPDAFEGLSSLSYDGSKTSARSRALLKASVANDVAKRIKSLVEGGLSVYSKRDGSKRNAVYGDFALLVRAKREAESFLKAFNALKIPCVWDVNQDFKGSYAVRVLENLLRLEYYLLEMEKGRKLDDSEKDIFRHCLASVERSFVLNVPDAKLVEEVKNAFSQDRSTRPVALKILDEVNASPGAKQASVDEICRRIVDAFKVFSKLSTVENPDASLAAYGFFCAQVDSLSSMGFSYLDFVEFFRELREGSLKSSSQEKKLFRAKGDALLITTIHKSKGLEYPFVILPMGDVLPKDRSKGEELSFDEEMGFLLKEVWADHQFVHSLRPLTPKGEAWNPSGSGEDPYKTALSVCFAQKRKDEERSERLRLLYVALTRARLSNLMVFFSDPRNAEKVKGVGKKDPETFFDFGAIAYDSVLPKAVEADVDDPSALLLERRDFDQPYPREDLERTAFSIRLADPLKDEIVRRPALLAKRASKEERLSSSFEDEAFGTKLHLALEGLDWTGFPSLPDTFFIEDGKIRALVDRFVALPLISRLKGRNPAFYQELPFYDLDSGRYGSIDFAALYGSEAVVIDYKAASLSDPDYIRQVGIYRKNIARMFSLEEKNVACYLYSILKSQLVEVKSGGENRGEE